jgi:hypothetical protein
MRFEGTRFEIINLETSVQKYVSRGTLGREDKDKWQKMGIYAIVYEGEWGTILRKQESEVETNLD